jgi:hypothetical protein
MAPLPSVASTDCAVDFGSTSICALNKEGNAEINDDFSSFSVLFGIDDDDDDDCSSFPS